MSKENKQEEPSSFKVTDKRHFTREGDSLADEEISADPAGEEKKADSPPVVSAAKEPEAPADPAPPPPPQAADGGPPQEEKGGTDGPVDFTHLVMSLASTAFYSLGLPDPVTKQKAEMNLPAASQMIDLLNILSEKTKGNLTPQEDQILTGTLTELRSIFVQVSGVGK